MDTLKTRVMSADYISVRRNNIGTKITKFRVTLGYCLFPLVLRQHLLCQRRRVYSWFLGIYLVAL